MSLCLRGRGISCLRQERMVFSDIGFSVPSGEGLLLLGSNGAGKTSLIRLIAGVLPLCEGEIRLEGTSLPLQESAHYIGHMDALKPDLSVQDNLSFWSDYLGSGDVEAALHVFGMKDMARIPVAYLSAGQKRKLALSRLKLIFRPLWLLDEPTISLDAQACHILEKLLQEHWEKGGIVVAATHYSLGVIFKQRLHLSG